MRFSTTHTCFVVVAASLLLGACSTPKPARDLAAQGAVVADLAKQNADSFLDRANRAYERREAIVSELARSEIEDVSGDAFRSYIAAKAGLPNRQAQIDLVKSLAEHSRTIREQAEVARAAHQKVLADSAGPAVKVNATSLPEVKRAFIVLSQELTAAEWVAFARGYLQQVNQELKALEAKDTPAK